ncbi:MAG: PadR family transcriptional regulator, partial [Candidatus Omnitrophica bacterium]|nr:PadR family transcriptional regulator [Candidatus Omnitrophota bacterium]
MKETEFILSGLLKESPKHPYQIKKEIKEFVLPFTGVKIDSVYYPLKMMESKGLVEKQIRYKKRGGALYIYKLT